ncbi:helix-turn-helix domain-containing protein [Corynebacterium tapiri]|uniref:Helix-turn-helix transcriptional regulator n=1 Tax=Corynebacterium tapiri TaxID=1448266 RepID=A0A5C4U6G6_9CORY|nr:helix-turn-helix transcriptional regulator [Corynebacterium tapiri]TNL99245.1 helix-turn-helix transcriptional regulator [Corynebacterium tapiri]
MMTTTALLTRPQPAAQEMLLREALGMTLRAFRADKNVTLRELAETARVSPGYLSELERGRKEVSSELLASICHALGVRISDVLVEAAGTMTLPSVVDELTNTQPAAAE